MKSRILVPDKIITADKQDNILTHHAVEIAEGKIRRIFPFVKEEVSSEEITYLNDMVMIPGFIQTHVHLCQTLFRGLADDLQLIDWLQYRIFPYENAHSKSSLRASVRLGIYELFRTGTTTIMDMGTLRHQEVIFEELISSGIRAFAGKCMMDRNILFPEFKSSTEDELKYTKELAGEYHDKTDLIKYGFAPRFVITCSEALLKETSEMMKDYGGSLFHTHASENKNECSTVREMFGCDNVEYFDRIGVLGEQTVLAHCVHLNENEKDILAKNNVSVAHCPSSNLKLGSGFAPIPELMKRGIKVSLGADGAPCNNNLSMFNEMRLASLIHKPVYGSDTMDARTIFRMATIGGAEALGISAETGSIEEGKNADIVLMDMNRYSNTFSGENDSLYSDIVYSSASEQVKYVMINGNWVVEDGKFNRFEEGKLISDGRNELKDLMRRI
jgi:5-methylthioadenosine/S-adenosylhomocysteine deaminase